MDKVFVYGMCVEGDNFTDRKKETARLCLNFENGVNTILISSRRIGKTSLVNRAISRLQENEDLLIIFMDIYDCRSEYDFYNRFASCVLQQTSSRIDQWVDNAKDFITRLSPRLSFSPEPNSEFAVSLGITPTTHTPEEVLSLPEKIAQKKEKHIVVCIDEFQQIGEMPDSINIQKRMRSVWQHQKNVSYCLFGSKKHLMLELFNSKRMPFYQFGEMMSLGNIPKEDWIEYIIQRFQSKGKNINRSFAEEICEITNCYSSYVQQLAWNVYAETEKEVEEQAMRNGIDATLAQCSALFMEQIQGLSSMQMNFLKAIASGIHSGFGSKNVLNSFNLGTKSNIARLQAAVLEKELVEHRDDGYYFADPLFALWYKENRK